MIAKTASEAAAEVIDSFQNGNRIRIGYVEFELQEGSDLRQLSQNRFEQILNTLRHLFPLFAHTPAGRPE
jgi:hypothetical protein